MPANLSNVGTTLRDTIGACCGKKIGINISYPNRVDSAILSSAHADHFIVEADGLFRHIPYTQIVRMISAAKGQVNLGMFKGKFPLIIKISALASASGGFSMSGISVPLGEV